MPKANLTPRSWDTYRPDVDEVKNEVMLTDVLKYIEDAEKDFKKAPTPENAEALKAYLFKFPSAADGVIKSLDKKLHADAIKGLNELSKQAAARSKEVEAEAKAEPKAAKTEAAGAAEGKADAKGKLSLSANVGPKQPNKRDDVMAVQRRLVKHGTKVATDGKFGPATQTAIENFQKKFMDPPSGIVERGSETEKQLSK